MIVNLFFEASTRTRTSFEIAAKRLGADAVSITASGSSVSKGESLVDTLNTLAAMRPDAIVMRHAASGAPHFLARHLPTPIINAGDGTHEHPTQALLDARTILDRRAHARRPARGHHRRHRAQPRGALQRAPAFEVRRGDRALRAGVAAARGTGSNSRPGVTLTTDIREAIRDADVIMMLRVQLERQHEAPFPGQRIFPLLRAAAGAPGPGQAGRHRDASRADQSRAASFRREVADFQRSVILNQVENGIAVRMAVLEKVIG